MSAGFGRGVSAYPTPSCTAASRSGHSPLDGSILHRPGSTESHQAGPNQKPYCELAQRSDIVLQGWRLREGTQSSLKPNDHARQYLGHSQHAWRRISHIERIGRGLVQEVMSVEKRERCIGKEPRRPRAHQTRPTKLVVLWGARYRMQHTQSQ